MSSITPSDVAKAVIRRNTEEVQGKRNFEVFAELFAADFAERVRLNQAWHAVKAVEETMKTISTTVPLGRFATPRRDRKDRGVSRIRRQQLHHGNGIVCRWRLRASLSD